MRTIEVSREIRYDGGVSVSSDVHTVKPENGTYPVGPNEKISVEVFEQPPRVVIEGDGIGSFTAPIHVYPGEGDTRKRYQAVGESDTGATVRAMVPEVWGWPMDVKAALPVMREPKKLKNLL